MATTKIRGLMGSSAEVVVDLTGNVGIAVTSKTGSALLLLTPPSRAKLINALLGTIRNTPEPTLNPPGKYFDPPTPGTTEEDMLPLTQRPPLDLGEGEE